MSNQLQLNRAKTDVLWYASACCQQHIPMHIGSTFLSCCYRSWPWSLSRC